MGSSHFWATVGLWQSRAWARMGLIWDRMGSDGLGCWCIISSEQWKCYWIMNRRSVCNSAETHMANNSEVGERSCCSLDEFLRKDAGVEVATDEDGFKGVWFEARIVDPPRNLQSDLKQDRLAVVEFQTLLSEDGFSLLVENADANFIRPSPPQETAKKPLKVNDLVDAFYLDGWWTGVVAEVKENGRYLVTFEDPPDAVEFGRANLRIHWDWIGGMWIRSKNSLHKQVSENQKQRRRWIEETTSTSRRKRGRPRKAITDENTKSCKRASSPVGEKTNRIGEKIMPEPEAISRHYTAPHVIENRSLPFAKTSTIWHAVDSMEAFNKFPQKPHFAPLHDLKEDHREGLAIAHMVTFSTITEKALGLHCSDPESSFLECLAALNDLGRHGFDIKPVEFHIKKMLSVKDQQERFREKARNVEKRIKELSECNEEIDKEIMEVGEKLKSLESKRRKNKMKVEMLRKSVEGMKKLIELC